MRKTKRDTIRSRDLSANTANTENTCPLFTNVQHKSCRTSNIGNRTKQVVYSF